MISRLELFASCGRSPQRTSASHGGLPSNRPPPRAKLSSVDISHGLFREPVAPLVPCVGMSLFQRGSHPLRRHDITTALMDSLHHLRQVCRLPRARVGASPSPRPSLTALIRLRLDNRRCVDFVARRRLDAVVSRRTIPRDCQATVRRASLASGGRGAGRVVEASRRRRSWASAPRGGAENIRVRRAQSIRCRVGIAMAEVTAMTTSSKIAVIPEPPPSRIGRARIGQRREQERDVMRTIATMGRIEFTRGRVAQKQRPSTCRTSKRAAGRPAMRRTRRPP